MKRVFESPYPQSHLLTADEFIRYLEKLDIRLTRDDLEYYDKKGIMRPVLRFRHEVSEFGFLAWSTFGPQILAMKDEMARVEFTKDNDFIPWEQLELSKREKIVPYYHQYQFILADHLLKGNGRYLSPRFIEEIDEVDLDRLKKWKTRSEQSLEIANQVAVSTWIPLIGFLILFEDTYGIFAKNSLSMDPFDPDYFDKWKEWRTKEYSSSNLLDSLRISVNDIKRYYEHLADSGHLRDPLAHWYPLLYLIKRSHRQRLKGQALLAQEYYDLATMVKRLIRDVTGEVMAEPDDRWDSDHASWKPRMYGDPFDYASPKTRLKIRDHYFVDRPPLISIIFEGDTEEIVIKRIFESLDQDPENQGYHLYNAKGSGNMDSQKLGALIDLAKMNQMDVYLIIDNDARSKDILQDHLTRGNIKEGMYTIWKKDFEYDNFGLRVVVNEINEMLREVGCIEVKIDDVEERMKSHSSVLMNAIDNVVGRVNGGRRLDEIISKPQLSEKLISNRIVEIPKEYAGEGWKPQLPIEKVLYAIFRRYPFTL